MRIAPIMLAISMVLAGFVYTSPPALASSEKFRVWIATDTHFNKTNIYQGSPYSWDVFSDAISDAEKDWGYTFDIAFILGDIADSGTAVQYQQFKDCLNTVPASHDREDFYIMAGNHDNYNGVTGRNAFVQYIDPKGDNTVDSGVNNSLRPYPLENMTNYESSYTVKVGNTLFICMSPDWGVNGGCYNHCNYTWFRQIVDNVSNDTNIIVFTHQPLSGSGLYCGAAYIENSQDFVSYLENHTGKINAWFCGHTHYVHDENRTYATTKWGTFFEIASGMDDGAGDTAAKSILLTFEVGNATVLASDYFHGYSSFNYSDNTEGWDGSDPVRGNQTFALTVPFSLENTKILDSANFTMEATVEETPSSLSVIDSATFTMEATVGNSLLSLLDSKTFTMSATIQDASNGSGFITTPDNSQYYLLAGLAVFFPFIGIIFYKKHGG